MFEQILGLRYLTPWMQPAQPLLKCLQLISFPPFRSRQHTPTWTGVVLGKSSVGEGPICIPVWLRIINRTYSAVVYLYILYTKCIYSFSKHQQTFQETKWERGRAVTQWKKLICHHWTCAAGLRLRCQLFRRCLIHHPFIMMNRYFNGQEQP